MYAEEKELVQEFKWEVCEYLPYSSDLAPSDCHLFSQIERYFFGIKHYGNGVLEIGLTTWKQLSMQKT